jgi:UDP-N-acetylmuramate: L-alanyl-gamma-D-glutamyl-meso-diaminopimelate ligase
MRIYFLGIGGTAMGNAAILLKKLGHEVLGSDGKIYPPMSDILKEAALEIYQGFDAKRLQELNPDLVVVGNAISRGNDEVEWLLDSRACSMFSLPQLLNDFLLKNKDTVIITGTHGKTTTATIAAYLLEANSDEPSWFIGGVPKSLTNGAHLGEGAHFVIEGDEYDSAFFDKRSKFIHYNPYIVSINNLEMDHADIFRDLPDIQRSFSHLIRLIPRRGYLIVNGDDENVLALLDNTYCSLLKVGIGKENDLVIKDFKEGTWGSSFKLYFKGQFWTEVEWSLQGLYNARNAASAALSAGIAFNSKNPLLIDLSALERFQGVKRRQEKLYEKENQVVYEDFAHHPSAISEILDSKRRIFPEHEIVACFEPRSNTSKSQLFQFEFTKALSKANVVLIGAINQTKEKSKNLYLDRACMVQQIQSLGESHFAEYFEENHELYSHLIQCLDDRKQISKPVVVVFFTNGSFDGIMKKLVNHLTSLEESL